MPPTPPELSQEASTSASAVRNNSSIPETMAKTQVASNQYYFSPDSADRARRPPKRKFSPCSPDYSPPRQVPRQSTYTTCCPQVVCTHTSPIPSTKLPPSELPLNQQQNAGPSTSQRRPTARRARRRPVTRQSFVQMLPRVMWAGFGKIRAPLKRLLRKKQVGQHATRLHPWSKAPCVASLFDVKWLDVLENEHGDRSRMEDDLERLLRTVVSPRPNRRRSAPPVLDGASADPSEDLDPNQWAGRQLHDIPEAEEDEEERKFLENEREFVEDYGRPLAESDMFEQVRAPGELHICDNPRTVSDLVTPNRQEGAAPEEKEEQQWPRKTRRCLFK